MNDAVPGVREKKQERKIFAMLCSEAVKCHFEVIETAPVTLLQFCLAKVYIPEADPTAVDVI